MPPQDRVWRHQGGDLREAPASEGVSQDGEPAPLAVIKPQSLTVEPRLQRAVLLTQIRERWCGVLAKLSPKSWIFLQTVAGSERSCARHAHALKHGGRI